MRQFASEGGEAPKGWGPKSHPETRGQKPYMHEQERVYCHYLSKVTVTNTFTCIIN